MKNFIVSYDLINQKNYPRLEAQIKKVDPHAVRVLMSLWHIKARGTVGEVYDRLSGALDADDKLLVVSASNACGDERRLGTVWTGLSERWNS